MRSEFKKTGRIWAKWRSRRTEAVLAVCSRLEAAHGLPRFGNPVDPVDDLVYIVTSNRTAPATAQRVYEELKSAFDDWSDMADAKVRRIAAILKPAGLSLVKARQLRRALRKIAADFGECSLEELRSWPAGDAEAYLTTLPGVSLKVAKCVLMYTLGQQVLPVDVHVHRLATRLGWTARRRADQSHEELEALVPPEKRYLFHVGAVAHGRAVCRPRPRCQVCPLANLCDYHKFSRDR